MPPSIDAPGDAFSRPVVLSVRSLSKSFDGIAALRDVALDVRAGEIHSIVGGNGSGKSTLIKALAGVQPADEGTLTIGGATYNLRHFTPVLARRCGVHVVHQHRTTFGPLTVAENLAMGRGFERSRIGGINWPRTRKRAADLIERYGIRATPDTRVSQLGPAAETMLEIARALQDQEGTSDGVLLLDEPTAALPPNEVGLLLDALRGYAAQGQAVIFVSHRLDEVLDLSERVTVLRDGLVTADLDRRQLSRDAIVEAMVGQLAISERTLAAPPTASVALEARGVSGGTVTDVDLTLREGEIVGVAGLAGSGRSTLLRLLFGAQPMSRGTIRIDGKSLDSSDPAQTIRRGLAMVPEDRAKDAAFADMSIIGNFSIADLRRFSRGGRILHGKERLAAEEAITAFYVKAASPSLSMRSVSGGNQQKVILARWLATKPRVLLLDEPTQGVDVGGRAELWDIIQKAAAAGLAVLLVSSDLGELTHLSTRLLIMREGSVVGELHGPGLTNDEVNSALHELDVAS